MSALGDAMMKTALIGMGAKLPGFNPAYCYNLQWQFDEDNRPHPHEQNFDTIQKALDAMITVWNTPKTLIHISLTRRNA